MKRREERKMFCENCGNQISDKDMYCACCGAKINKRCVGPSQDQNYVTPEWEQIPPNDQWPSNQANPVRMNQPAPMPANKEAASSGIRNVYFVDFLCRLFSKENIPLCIYLVINMVIIGGIMSVLFVLPLQWGMLSGFFVYLATIVIALSPIGEFIVRFQTGCKKIKDPEIMSRLEPLFYEVYQKAKMQEPLISDSVRLYMNDDESENAFATGRRTICVTRGLLNMPDEVIKATLGHEFGHLAHKDTDRCLLVVLGNTAIAGICTLIELGALFFNIVASVMAAFTRNENSFIVAMFGVFSSVVMLGIVRCFTKLWTWIGILLVMKTSRNNEYMADAFSCRLGYRDSLCLLLQHFGDDHPKGLFASLASSHPENADRINHILNQGVAY